MANYYSLGARACLEKLGANGIEPYDPLFSAQQRGSASLPKMPFFKRMWRGIPAPLRAGAIIGAGSAPVGYAMGGLERLTNPVGAQEYGDTLERDIAIGYGILGAGVGGLGRHGINRIIDQSIDYAGLAGIKPSATVGRSRPAQVVRNMMDDMPDLDEKTLRAKVHPDVRNRSHRDLDTELFDEISKQPEKYLDEAKRDDVSGNIVDKLQNIRKDTFPSMEQLEKILQDG